MTHWYKERIPGLTPLKFDEPYKMENQTLKSVVFTRTKHNNKVLFEYLAVVHKHHSGRD